MLGTDLRSKHSSNEHETLVCIHITVYIYIYIWLASSNRCMPACLYTCSGVGPMIEANYQCLSMCVFLSVGLYACMSVCQSIFDRVSVTLHDLFVQNVEFELPRSCRNELGKMTSQSPPKHDDLILKLTSWNAFLTGTCRPQGAFGSTLGF